MRGKIIAAAVALAPATLVFGALDRVDLVIADSARKTLEADPYHAPKVPALWIADDDTFEVGTSYRGAWSLRTLMADRRGLRNWKVKAPKAHPYRGYREWNFNFEQHLREKLALDLFARAGVPAMPARFVVLHINGTRQGVYLEFPDPDNKAWLMETFGADSGDLYKVTTDYPDAPARFGEFTNLGDEDSAYWGRYVKKLHADGPDSLDYSVIRKFVTWINRSNDSEFYADLESKFDVATFLRFLVVVNYSSSWDVLPNRSKNVWMHRDRRDKRWTMIPWDQDATFQYKSWCMDNMGVDAGLFFMEWPAGYCPNELETQERPLFTRIMKNDAWKRQYVSEYRKAMRTWLHVDSLLARVDSLDALVLPELSGTDKTTFLNNRSDMRTYIEMRSATVASLLEAQPADPVVEAATRRTPERATASGPWLDIRGRRVPSLENAPTGVWRRGAEARAILR